MSSEYASTRICYNCHSLETFNVTKGVTVKDYIRDKKPSCKNCEFSLN